MPFDVRAWRIRVAGRDVPLWQLLRARLEYVAGGDRLAAWRWAAVGRIGTVPDVDLERSDWAREQTAIAFAAIQVLAVHGDPSLLWVQTLRPECRDRVLGVRAAGGVYVAPEFTTTDEALQLPAGSVVMDNGLSVVKEQKSSFPGYFVHSGDAARVLATLLADGRLTVDELSPAIAAQTDRRARQTLAAVQADRDHARLAELLTEPARMKHLIPLLAGRAPLSRMSAEEFQARLLWGTRDGPFSSTVTPARWQAGLWRVLEAAEEMSGEAERRTRPTEPTVAV